MEIKQLDIDEVVENPDNPRRKLGDISSLVASIKAIGLVEPIVVRQLDDQQYLIVSGARRYVACKRLGHETIPCIVREDETNESLASIAENTAREDLSVDELAVAVNRLAGLSMSDEELSAALAISPSDVGHARLISKASKKAKEKLKELAPKTRQFSLEESAVVVKYAGDAARLEEITETLEYEPQQMPHVIARFEDEDARIATVEALRKSMAGKIEVKPFRSWERPQAGAEPLHNLVTSDGKTLTEKRHQTCPNAGFLIMYEDSSYSYKKPEIVSYCIDWEASGHKLSDKPKQIWNASPSRGSAKKPASEEASAERRLVIANNKLWGPAKTVRTAWLEEFCQRRELDTAAKQWVLGELIIEPTRIARSKFVGKVASFEHRFVIVFTQLVDSRERDLNHSTWRPQSYVAPVFDRYFRMLKDQGYPVSEVEANLILDGATPDADLELDEFGDVA